MRKILMAVAAFGMLLTSCAKDDVAAPVEQKEALVSFCVNSPAVATRYGEGTTAQDLYYAVYDTQEGYVSGLSKVDGSVEINLSTTVNFNLVQGRYYEIIFWAQNENAPYTLTWGNAAADAKMTINDVAALVANEEDYDAFYYYSGVIEVKGAISQTAELKRPFAQLNVATADTTLASTAGVDIATTGVTVAGVYSSFGFKDGAVIGEAVTAAFAPTAKAEGKITANGKEYDHIAMNYLLVNEKKLVDVTLTLAEDNTTTALTRSYTSVPVQRNYRTNIVGNILTSPADFKVEIKPGFADEVLGDDVWTGGSEEIIPDADGVYNIMNGNHLAWVGEKCAEQSTFFYGKTLRLGADINLASNNWKSIAASASTDFPTTFDGNHKTIYGLTAPLFSTFTGTAKNLTIDGAKITSDAARVAVFATNMAGNIENVKVVNATINATANATADAKRWGAIVGLYRTGNATDCVAENVTINGAYSPVGGLFGTVNEVDNRTFTNCVAKNVNITMASGDEAAVAGAIIGEILISGVNLVDCSQEGSNPTVLVGKGNYTQTVDDVPFKANAIMYKKADNTWAEAASLSEAWTNGAVISLGAGVEASLAEKTPVPNNITVKGLKGSEATITCRLYVGGACNATFENLNIKWNKTNNVPIEIDNATADAVVTFKGCNFNNDGGFYLGKSSAGNNGGFIHINNQFNGQLIVEECTFKSGGRFGIWGHLGGHATKVSRINNNTFSNCGFAIEGPKTVQNIEFNGNTTTGSYGYLRIVAGDSSYTIKNVWFENNTLAMTLDQTYLSANANIENCYWRGNNKNLSNSLAAKFITE